MSQLFRRNDKKDKRSMIRTLSDTMFILGIAIKAAPFTVLYKLIHPAIKGIIIYFEHTVQLMWIINHIQHGSPFYYVLRIIVIMFIIVSFEISFNSYIVDSVAKKGDEKILRAFRELLYDKAKDMDIACYDNPEFYNDYVFTMENIEERVNGVINTAGQLIGNVLSLAVIGGFVIMMDRMSVVFILAAFVSSYIIQLLLAKANFNLDRVLNPLFRKRDYIGRVFYLPDYAKEIRLSNVSKRLHDEYIETEKQVLEELQKRTKKIAVLDFFQRYFTDFFIFSLVYLLYLMYLALVRGAIAFGTLYGLFRSASSAQRNIEEFSKGFAALKQHSLYTEKIRDFLNYERTVISPIDAKPIPKTAGSLELRDVCFTYPGTESPSLSNVSLSIRHGEKVAIVGYNGAGKTTLVKLLMRLYDPDSGIISYTGEDIKSYDLADYRNMFATLFQNYQIYATTLAQNISVSDDVPDEDEIIRLIDTVGLTERVSQMPDGIHSQLLREFTEGEELSGGERQKLAICRALYKNSPIIILDEPSSALDPIAEFELNNTMMQLGRDKTVIIISHRLSTTKNVDRILMFDKGQLIESGSHDELMTLGGKYKEMFNLQAEKYR